MTPDRDNLCVFKPTMKPALIPRALLFGNPSRISPQLSPDGRSVSFLAPFDGVLNVWVAPADRPGDAVPVTRDRTRGIQIHFWPHVSSHLCYARDQDGDENFHLYSVPAAGGEPLDLTPFGAIQARLVGLSRKAPRQALIGCNRRDPRWHDILRIDLITGAAELLEENPGFAGYVAGSRFARPRTAARTLWCLWTRAGGRSSTSGTTTR